MPVIRWPWLQSMKQQVQMNWFSLISAQLLRAQNHGQFGKTACRTCFHSLYSWRRVKSIKDIGELLHSGADKVSLGTAAVERPELVTAAVQEFGKGCLVVAIDARQIAPGR